MYTCIITGTGKAEDPITKISVANEAGMCVCIQIITLVMIVMACFTDVAPLEQCWITLEEDVIPEKKDNSPKPLPSEWYNVVHVCVPCTVHILYMYMYIHVYTHLLFFHDLSLSPLSHSFSSSLSPLLLPLNC